MIIDLMDLLDDEYKRIGSQQHDMFTEAKQYASTGDYKRYKEVNLRANELVKAQSAIVRKMRFIRLRRIHGG